jgi:hypothetical protein
MATAIQVGTVYSIRRGQDAFGVVKVVAFQPEERAVYARTFSPYFKERPVPNWFEQGDASNFDEELGVGIGVLPITVRVFQYWEPERLFAQEVSEPEQEDLSYCLGLAQPWDDLKYP